MSRNFFAYYRVSSKSQEREGVSLDAQREAILSYATRQGMNVVKEFREVQSASKVIKRKKFFEMIDEIESNEDIAGIIFHDVDRSSRNFRDWGIINNLMDEGLEIHLSREGIQLKSDGDRLLADVKAVMAVNDTRVLSTRVKEGMYRKTEDGYSMWGHAPTGYISEGQGVRVPDPVMSSLISECFELYATEKYSLEDLCVIMNKKGLRSKFGKKMTTTRMGKLLGNQYYLGLIHAKGKVYPGNHQPLVSKEVFDKVQAIKSGRGPIKKKLNEYKFMGILFCGLCGKRLRSTTAKHKYHYYYCRNKECPSKPIPEDLVEQWILAELEKFKFNQEQVDEMVKKAKESKKSMVLAMEQKRETIKLQIEQTKSRLGKLVERELDGEIPQEIYTKKRDELNSTLKNLEGELLRISSANGVNVGHIVELSKLLADPVYAYQKANWEQKRKLVNSLMQNVVVNQVGIVYKKII